MGRKLRHRHDRYELSNALTITSVMPLPPFRLPGRTHQSLRDPSSQPEADGVERVTAKAASAKPLKSQGNTRTNPCGILANCAGKHEASGVGCGRVQATSQGVIGPKPYPAQGAAPTCVSSAWRDSSEPRRPLHTWQPEADARSVERECRS